MTSIDVHPAHLQALQAIAELDDTDVDTVVARMLDAALDARTAAIERAYLALTGRPDAAAGDVLHTGGAVAPSPAIVGEPWTHDGDPHLARRMGDDAAETEKDGQDDPAAASPLGPRTCDRDGCDRRHRARGMCSSHYARWRDGSDPHAPDGAPSPALDQDAADVEPVPPPTDDGVTVDVTRARVDWERLTRGQEAYVGRAAELDEDDPMCCQAARCRAEKIAEDAKFCPHHTSQVPRIADKIRRGPNPPANPFEAACERLIAGRR